MAKRQRVTAKKFLFLSFTVLIIGGLIQSGQGQVVCSRLQLFELCAENARLNMMRGRKIDGILTVELDIVSVDGGAECAGFGTEHACQHKRVIAGLFCGECQLEFVPGVLRSPDQHPASLPQPAVDEPCLSGRFG